MRAKLQEYDKLCRNIFKALLVLTAHLPGLLGNFSGVSIKGSFVFRFSAEIVIYFSCDCVAGQLRFCFCVVFS